MPLDKVEKIIWLSGYIGRDPSAGKEPQNREGERAGIGRVVVGIKEQTIACWTGINKKNIN